MLTLLLWLKNRNSFKSEEHFFIKEFDSVTHLVTFLAAITEHEFALSIDGKIFTSQRRLGFYEVLPGRVSKAFATPEAADNSTHMKTFIYKSLINVKVDITENSRVFNL